MKLSSQDLEQSNYKVLIQEPGTNPRVVTEPVEVDTDAGTVILVKVNPVPLPLTKNAAGIPVPHAEEYVVKTGKVWVLDAAHKVVAHGPK